MKRLSLIFVVLLLAAFAYCQPPFRTDLTIIQDNAVIPYSGLTGPVIATDPDFGAKEGRCTFAASGPGGTMTTTDDSSAANVWNSDGTLLLLSNPRTGNNYVFQFNKATLACTQLANPTTGVIQGVTVWSRVNPGCLYNIAAPPATLVNCLNYVNTAGTWAYSSTTAYADFGPAHTGGTTPCVASGTVQWQGTLSISQGDTVMFESFSTTGLQNTGVLACAFIPASAGSSLGSGYRVFNTNTLAVTGDWGTTGTMTCLGGGTCISGQPTLTSFLIHDSSQTPNPLYATMTYSGASFTFVWYIPSIQLGDDLEGGHKVLGYYSEYTGAPGGGQFLANPYSFAGPTVSAPCTSSACNIIPTTTEACPPCYGPSLPAHMSPAQTYLGDQHSQPNPVAASGGADAFLFWTSNGPQTVTHDGSGNVTGDSLKPYG